MTFERRSPSTATESASSSAGGLRRRGQHPLQRELRQLREEAERGGEPEPENVVARRGAMVELYHVTSFGERPGLLGIARCGCARHPGHAPLPELLAGSASPKGKEWDRVEGV